MLYINAKPGDKLNLGRKGENLARTILFDISQWRKLYGDGVVALLHQRAGDAYPYPCDIETDGNTVSWSITAADTAVASQYGKYELQYRVNDQLAKSATGAASVYESLGESTAEPPEAQQGWVDKVLQAGAEAEAAAKRAEAAADKAEGSGGGGGGTTDHDKLRNRDAADQHPMSAITGLEKALEGKQPTGTYLTPGDLDGAVNEALQIAKDSGEFDGADGKDGYTPQKGVDYFDGAPGEKGADGVGIQSVMQTTASAEDGGENIITVTKTDGTKSTFSVKNGRKGIDGKNGQDGYTPVKGVDYFDGAPGKDGTDGYTPQKGVDYFDGEPGKDGEPGQPGADGYTPQKGVDYFDGEDGYTPVKGTDYFTEADKQEIVSAVLANFTDVSEVGL